MNLRRKGTLFVWVFSLSLLLSLSASAQSEPITLSVWVPDASWAWSNPDWALPEFIEWFEANNPDIKLDMTPYPGNRTERYMVQYASGLPMDVIWVASSDRPPLANNGMLMDLYPYFDRDPIVATGFFDPAFVRTGEYSNQLIAMPDVMTWRAIILSEDRFAAVGLDLPSMQVDETWDLDQFEEATRRLVRSDGTGNVTRYGFSVSLNSERLDGMARLFGGRFYNQELGRIDADSPEALDAFSTLRRMAVEIGVTPPLFGNQKLHSSAAENVIVACRAWSLSLAHPSPMGDG